MSPLCLCGFERHGLGEVDALMPQHPLLLHTRQFNQKERHEQNCCSQRQRRHA